MKTKRRQLKINNVNKTNLENDKNVKINYTGNKYLCLFLLKQVVTILRLSEEYNLKILLSGAEIKEKTIRIFSKSK